MSNNKTLLVGPRGGQYYISPSGNKIYIQNPQATDVPTQYAPQSPKGKRVNSPVSPRANWIKPDSTLTEQQGKYCRCTIQVAAKQTPECLKEVSEGRHTPRQGCANPYPICANSIGTSTGRGGCSKHFDFNQIPDEFLISWLHLHGIHPREGATRNELLTSVQDKMRSKGEM